LFFSPTSLPPILTDFDPDVVSDAFAVLGYGIGIGPAGGDGGDMHTSGIAQIDLFESFLADISLPFA
jgi:hypothetical protein